jgi:hypothetical protein
MCCGTHGNGRRRDGLYCARVTRAAKTSEGVRQPMKAALFPETAVPASMDADQEGRRDRNVNHSRRVVSDFPPLPARVNEVYSTD